ncbi:MAG: DUF6259 domain-containing protein [Bacteroidales bacterium]|nr:DUF6259 domain-containing protein [Bacteroidales bacterium]
MLETTPEWKLVVETLDGARTESVISSSVAAPVVSAGRNTITYQWVDVSDSRIDVIIEYTIHKGGEDFEVSKCVVNNGRTLVVKSIEGPYFSCDGLSFDNWNILVPNGPGMKLSKAPADSSDTGIWQKEGDRYTFSSEFNTFGTTMSWFAFEGKGSKAGNTIYVNMADPRFRGKLFHWNYYPQTGLLGFGTTNLLSLHPGDTFTGAPMQVSFIDGSWHEAADRYRAWFDSVKGVGDSPEWLKNSSGWLLAILKQQNTEIIWDYRSISNELLEVASGSNLDIIGLFGWAHGGHDRFYPEYFPDPEMGGEDALKKAIEEVHEKGKRVIIYANGQLIDQNGTDFWGETGCHITSVKKDGSFYYEQWRKYSNAPGRIHGIACSSSPVWHRILLDLAIQAAELGADGIIYDQIAYDRPRLCYSPEHGHPVPSLIYDEDKYAMLDWIKQEMEKDYPEFVIMSEGLSDEEMHSLALFHGGTYAVQNMDHSQMQKVVREDEEFISSAFPSMFMYTFPEAFYTYRNPSPAHSREVLNYCTLFKFRDEFEVRYAPDRKYVLEGVVPVREDYGTVLYGPDLGIIASDAGKYAADVLAFQRRNSEFLWNGKFLDNLGFSFRCDSEDVIARAYSSEDGSLAVALWNDSEEVPATCSVKVKGKKFVKADSPEGETGPSEPLAPQSIRLLIFK